MTDAGKRRNARKMQFFGNPEHFTTLFGHGPVAGGKNKYQIKLCHSSISVNAGHATSMSFVSETI
jgi:hypothetical protein